MLRLACVSIALLGLGCASSPLDVADPDLAVIATPVDLRVVDDLSVAGDLARMGCQPPCAGDKPYCNARNVCVQCLEDTHCKFGQVCRTAGMQSFCIPGCDDDARCGPPPDGGAASLRCCEGACTRVDSNKDHCGACRKRCSAAHASVSCANGECMLGACNPGWGDCNGLSADDCETNLASNVDHCGACNMACKLANAAAGCAHGCYVVACSAGWADCNGVAKDGCETDIFNDSSNCGRCGTRCAQGKSCKNAACI